MSSSTASHGSTWASRSVCGTYAGLLLLRFVCTFGPGYVHPDEWFQYGEVLGDDFFGITTLRTWEFDPSFPCRSMASIRLWGMPLLWLARFVKRSSLSSTWWTSAKTLFLVQRLTFFALSLVVDASLLSVLRLHAPHVRSKALLRFASSGALFGLGIRPFSNNAELIILSVCIMLERSLSRLLSAATPTHEKHTKSDKKSDNVLRWHILSALLGGFAAIGIFTRFTFAIFAAPVGISYIRLSVKRAVQQQRHPQREQRPLRRSIDLVLQLRSPLLAFFAVSFAHIAFDSWYYASQTQPNVRVWQALLEAPIFVPLNAFRYNRRHENLAQHGIHPHWLHVVVNAPIVLGMTAWIGVLQDTANHLRGKKSVRPSRAGCESQDCVATLSLGIILLSIAVLSVQPHQEPRFLQPLLMPAALHYGLLQGGATSYRTRWRKVMRALGFVQIVFITLLFTFLHQAGTIPAMLRWNSFSASSVGVIETDLLFWRSFMPPRHLIVPPSNDWSGSGQQLTAAVRVLDLGSASRDQLSIALKPRAGRSKALFAPMWAVGGLQREGEDDPSIALRMQNLTTTSVEQRYFPHVDMDHLPESLQMWREGSSLIESFSYGVWRIG